MASSIVDGDGNRDEPSSTATSAEVARRFGQLRDMPEEHVTFITHHGRITHALTTASHYNSLIVGKGDAVRTYEPTPAIFDFFDCLPSSIIVIGYDLKILCVNTRARFQLGLSSNINELDIECIPIVCSPLIKHYVRRSISSREPFVAELPDIFGHGTWTKFEIRPLSRYVVVLFYNITEDIKQTRLADPGQSLREAIAVDDAIGYVCLNTRGEIDQTDPTFRQIVDIDEIRLHQIKMANLISIDQREDFREALNKVLDAQGARTIDSAILTGDGSHVLVRITIAELRNTIDNEGAVIVITKR